ncbi:MAG TPA: branched-chain amino acid ABC transporter permease [Clostridiaceae bacterium]|nr:branched-chain amino acid ABC transporter permease [Clostridiaceae bacterium]
MFLQQLVNGLTIGGIYALIAIGYSLVYGILRIVNFAHGDIFMMGSFFGLIISKASGLSFLVVAPIAMACTGMLGMLVERLAYRPLRGADSMSVLICAMGVSTLLANLAQLIFGTQTHLYSVGFQLRHFQFGSVSITNLQFIMVIITVVSLTILLAFVKKTKFGIAMRATSNNLTTAKMMGINTNIVISITFAIGSMLASGAGMMVGMYYDAVFPTMGFSYGIKAFAAAVLGGIGSLPGAMLGGLTIGVVESLGSAYLSSGYRNAFAFGIMIIVLILKPTGIMGKVVREKV